VRDERHLDSLPYSIVMTNESAQKWERVLLSRKRIAELKSALEEVQFPHGVVTHSPILLHAWGDFQITAERVPKTACSRDQFEEMYTRFTEFELKYNNNTVSLIDILMMVDIHICVPYTDCAAIKEVFRVVLSENACVSPRCTTEIQQSLYTASEIERAVEACLFWGDRVRGFHVNFRDGNDKFVTAESDSHYYCVHMGTS
jgi:hypothetical protein